MIIESYNHKNDNILTNEDCEIFREVVGNSVNDLKKEIKNSDVLDRIFSEEKFINNNKLNELGLHIYRILYSRRIFLQNLPSNEIAKEWVNKGYVVIENFFSDRMWDKIKNLSQRYFNILPKDGSKHSVELKPIYISDISDKIKQTIFDCLRIETTRGNIQRGLHRMERISVSDKDYQNDFHTDIFSPNYKSWCFLHDINKNQSPTEFIIDSNKRDINRLKWDYEKSINIKSEITEESFRLNDNYKDYKTKTFTGKANTMIIIDTFSFHRRGNGINGLHRETLFTSFRKNPFKVYKLN